MTENERMSISGLLDVLNTGISLSTCHMEYAIQSNVLEDLILCLEELEQYRAIGTVESLKNLPAICDSLAESCMKAEKLIEELKAYRAIGTVEGYKRAVEVSKENYYLCAEYKARLKEYEAIGTIDEFKALKEKNEPKKLNNSLEEDGKIGGYCPNCNGTVLIQKTFLRTSKGKCCDWCGQKIDWSE